MTSSSLVLYAVAKWRKYPKSTVTVIVKKMRYFSVWSRPPAIFGQWGGARAART